jgi:hypothetical protein
MLKGTVPTGVYFPEEVPGKQFRNEILADISMDAITYTIDVGSALDSSFTYKV